MKKYFFIAVAAVVALAACTKNEADTTAYEQGKVINFNTVAGKATKAPITGTTYSYNCPDFGVFASYLEKNKTWAANKADAVRYMDDVTVTFDDTKDIWVPEDTYYWPLEGSLSFIAYSPAAAATAAFAEETGTLTLTGFSVNTTVEDQVDLLYSSVNADRTANESYYNDDTNNKHSQTAQNDKGVNIKFKHALAQVVFKAKAHDDVYDAGLSFKVNSITVNAVKTATSMTVVNPQDADLAADITTWTIPATPTKDDFLVNTTAFPSATVAVEGTGNEGTNFLTDDFSTGEIGSALLMIPVKDNTDNDTDDAFDVTDPTVTIVYTLYRLSDAQPLGQKTVTVHFNTIDGTVKEWLAGKKYIYQFTIDLDKIYFNPTVTDWAAGGTQTFDVPKDGTTI